MSKDPAVLFYISDWLTSTAEMDSDCRGWYLNLILHNYDKGSLPNDIEKLAVLAGVSPKEFNRFEQVFEQVLKQKFEQTESGRLTNLRTQNILKARENFKDKRSNSGKLSYILKFFRQNHRKDMTKPFTQFVKDNIEINKVDTKSEQVLEQVFEHLLKLYRNENGNNGISTIERNKEFYAREISQNKEGSIINQYKMVADFIQSQETLSKMQKQLDYKGFVTCYKLAKEYNYKISDFLKKMENWKDGGQDVASKNKCISRTLQNWMNNEAKRSGKI